MDHRTHEICLAKDLTVLVVRFVQRCNQRIGHINDFIANHPQRTDILQVVGHCVGGCLEQGVGTLSGQADVIGRKFRQLEIVAAIRVAARPSKILNLVLEQGVASIHDGGRRLFYEYVATLLI